MDAAQVAAEQVADRYRAALAHGETRELSLTGYDRVGLPVVATTWRGVLPDGSDYDAHGVGYGESPAEAAVGAWGELAERVLLAPVVRALAPRVASYAALLAEAGPTGVVDPLRLVLEAGTPYDHDRPLTWVQATRWTSGEPVWVPVEMIAFDAATLAGFAPAEQEAGWLTTPITNGMGAGDTTERAVAHALLELLQRDGDTVSFRALDQGVVLDLDHDHGDGVRADARRVLAVLRAAGLDPVVKLAAVEPVPVVYAVARDPDPGADPMALSAVGEAAHPDLDEAVHKALLELASSRARRVFAFGPLGDVERRHADYLAEELAHPLGAQEPRALAETAAFSRLDPDAARALLEPVLLRVERTVSPAQVRADVRAAGDLDDPPTMLAHLLGLLAEHLRDVGGLDVLVVATPPGSPMHAAKVVVPGLEVETLSYLRLGERVAARLLARQAASGTAPVLVGLGEPDRPGRLAVPLTDAARERVGGPVWLDRDEVERVVGALYSLYREPRRHAVGRTGAGSSDPGLHDVRRAQDRDLSQEGIAMYLALVDARPGAGPLVPSTGGEAEVAERLDRLRAAVAPSQRDDDLGVTATLLAAAAHRDFGLGQDGS